MTLRSTTDESEVSTGQLIAAIKDDLSGLVRDEIDLAKAEVREDVKSAGIGAAVVAGAGFLAVLAVILLSIALAYGLTALGLAPGWAFLIVAGLYLLVAFVLVLVAKNRFGALGASGRIKGTTQDKVQALRGVTKK